MLINLLRWYIPQNIPKRLFKYGEERSSACNCSHEKKKEF